MLRVRFTEDEWHQLEAYAENADLSKSEVVRRALAELGVIQIAEG